jgi:DHA1 family bicyclomycin/chloramphenicol resistance-like MFS transporter
MLFSAGISVTLPWFYELMPALSAALLLMSFCLAAALIALVGMIATCRPISEREEIEAVEKT